MEYDFTIWNEKWKKKLNCKQRRSGLKRSLFSGRWTSHATQFTIAIQFLMTTKPKHSVPQCAPDIVCIWYVVEMYMWVVNWNWKRQREYRRRKEINAIYTMKAVLLTHKMYIHFYFFRHVRLTKFVRMSFFPVIVCSAILFQIDSPGRFKYDLLKKNDKNSIKTHEYFGLRIIFTPTHGLRFYWARRRRRRCRAHKSINCLTFKLTCINYQTVWLVFII